MGVLSESSRFSDSSRLRKVGVDAEWIMGDRSSEG